MRNARRARRGRALQFRALQGEGGGVKGHSIPYSAEELAWLEENRDWPISLYHKFFVMFFGRDDVSAVNLHSLRKRKGWKTGRTGCFGKGQVPHNKGQHYCPPGSEKGWFRKGERRGVAVRLYKPIGTERVSKDGYRERKIHDEMPLQSRWRAVHLIEWEAANGPLPKGYCLKCLNGDKANTDPSNWEAVPRALLPRLAGGNRYRRVLAFDDAEPEIRPSLLAIAKLEHKARTAKPEPQEQ
jgi:hypothetical protein